MNSSEVNLQVQKLRELEEGDVELHILHELRAARVGIGCVIYVHRVIYHTITRIAREK